MANTRIDLPSTYAQAYDALPQGILITDAYRGGNPIVYCNPGFERLTGYSEPEILGRNCNFLQGPGTDPAEVARIRRAIEQRRVYRGLILNYRKDGAEFWNDLTVGAIADGAQPERYLGGVQLDATPRLELEDRLRESQKMEALGKLTGGIAHDFNNLLALILGNAEVIVGKSQPGTVIGDAASDIVEASLAGSSLVKRMLDFSRGRPRQPERIAVNRVVEDVIALLTRTIREPICVECDLAPDTGDVIVDGTLFETALINLALNARDAMPDGGVLTFATRRRSDGLDALGAAVSVTVTDTGTGMDDETCRRAFEPYYSTKGPERGTGLGLAMVYSFAQHSGGRALISSKPGRGTVVELRLPAAATRLLNAPDDNGKGSAPKLLLVEDEVKIRSLLAAQLKSEGFVIDEAGTYEEATRHLENPHGYAAIISDIRLPGSAGGLDLVDHVRARKLPIGMVLMTGFSDELANASGYDNITLLSKPFRKSELVRAVRAITG